MKSEYTEINKGNMLSPPGIKNDRKKDKIVQLQLGPNIQDQGYSDQSHSEVKYTFPGE